MLLHHLDIEGNITNKYKRGKNLKSPILKKYGITNSLLSKWFNYSSPSSFNGSKAKLDMLEGVEKLIKHVEERHLLANN